MAVEPAKWVEGVSSEILADQNAWIALGLLTLAVIIAALPVVRIRKTNRQDLSRKRGATIFPVRTGKQNQLDAYIDISDPKMQMEVVSRAGYEKVRLMNKEEYGVFVLLENVVSNFGQGHRIMSQTSLGEVIRAKTNPNEKRLWSLAQSSINSKRLDFAIFDRSGLLVLAIEYQGSGHYQSKSFMRDAVKKEALRKAGVDLLEVPAKFDPKELKSRIAKALDPRQL